jgi:hypothetical protein
VDTTSGGGYQIYRWTAGEWPVLLGGIQDKQSVNIDETADDSEPLIGDDGSVLLTSDAPYLPGANGVGQVYLWTPPK